MFKYLLLRGAGIGCILTLLWPGQGLRCVSHMSIVHTTMTSRGCRPLQTGSNINLIYIEGVWSLSTVDKRHMVTLPCWYPPHSVLWSHCKWNQPNFFSHQNPCLCPAKLELKCIDTFQWCLQKRPGRGSWLLVVEIGFWADIEKLRIFQCENCGFGMFYLVRQPKVDHCSLGAESVLTSGE